MILRFFKNRKLWNKAFSCFFLVINEKPKRMMIDDIFTWIFFFNFYIIVFEQLKWNKWRTNQDSRCIIIKKPIRVFDLFSFTSFYMKSIRNGHVVLLLFYFHSMFRDFASSNSVAIQFLTIYWSRNSITQLSLWNNNTHC